MKRKLATIMAAVLIVLSIGQNNIMVSGANLKQAISTEQSTKQTSSITQTTTSTPTIATSLSEDRELWLTFDEENVLDGSINQLSIGDVGNLSYETGYNGTGKALTFNSPGQAYINLGKSDLLQSEQITFAAWIKAPKGGFIGEQILIWCKPSAQWYGGGYYITLNHSGAVYLNVGQGTDGDAGSGMFQAYSGSDINDFFPEEEWVHLAVSFDSKTNEAAFYRNGAKMAHTILDNTIQFIEKDQGQDKFFGASGYGNGLTGSVDEIALYSRIVTAEEVQELAGVILDEMLEKDGNELFIPSNVSEDFTLTTEGNYGSKITWESANPSIQISSNQAKVMRGNQDVTGKLIATISTGEASIRKEFDVTVKEKKNYAKAVSFQQVNITDQFWSARQKQVICSIIQVGIEKVEAANGGFNNFIEATKKNQGQDAKPFEGDVYFLDSDIYKIIEAMSYGLQVDANGDEDIIKAQEYFREKLDDWIPYIVGAQESDGYIDTFFTLDRGSQRMSATTTERQKWKDFAAHEMYVAGHLYEAAVELFRATGDTRLLDVSIKNADLVNQLFGEGKGNQASGHQEIEVGLVKLAAACTEAATNQAKGAYQSQYGNKSDTYVKLARRLLDVRGDYTDRVGYYSFLPNDAQYRQDHELVVNQTEGVGHVVRAMYQYMAMTDVALLSDTYVYDHALTSLWEDISKTKTYVTGGMGVEGKNEGFGASYELPNEGAYSETCGSIASVMWNQRMNLFYGDAKYADQMEQTLYNAVIDGVNFDGDKFFYQNPISSNGNVSRSAWFGCACCPPNLMRLINSLGSYIYTQDNDVITLNMYIGNEADLLIADKNISLKLDSDMPWEGNGKLTVTQADNIAFTLRLRIPAWAKGDNEILVNGTPVDLSTFDEDCYIVINRVWNENDEISITFPMTIERVYTDEKVTDNIGTVAIQRGPIVYAAEAVDNDYKLDLFTLGKDVELSGQYLDNLVGGDDPYGIKGGVIIKGKGKLYTINDVVEQEITLIPYYAWNNRTLGEMRVFLNESKDYTPSIDDFAVVSASYTSIWQVLSSINDKNDTTFWCSWIEGSVKMNPWVMYEFDMKVPLKGCSVNWMSDSSGVRVPKGIILEYWTGTQWKEVTPTHGYDTFISGQYNDYLFETVNTSKIRMTMENNNINGIDYALAIHEWKLFAEEIPALEEVNGVEKTDMLADHDDVKDTDTMDASGENVEKAPPYYIIPIVLFVLIGIVSIVVYYKRKQK